MKSPIFILGLRRSGTSILRELVLKHPEVSFIDFEPHELFFVIESIGINRYKRSEYHQAVIKRYSGNPDTFTGCKVACNAGIEAMRWKRLEECFDNPYYIFIKRNPHDTYNSWIKNETSTRGIVSYDMYQPWWEHINNSFEVFVYQNSNRSCIIQYEKLINNTDREMDKVWDMLEVPILGRLNQHIKLPENRGGLK